MYQGGLLGIRVLIATMSRSVLLAACASNAAGGSLGMAR